MPVPFLSVSQDFFRNPICLPENQWKMKVWRKKKKTQRTEWSDEMGGEMEEVQWCRSVRRGQEICGSQQIWSRIWKTFSRPGKTPGFVALEQMNRVEGKITEVLSLKGSSSLLLTPNRPSLEVVQKVEGLPFSLISCGPMSWIVEHSFDYQIFLRYIFFFLAALHGLQDISSLTGCWTQPWQ